MKWLMVVLVVGSSGDGVEGLTQVGPFGTEKLCEEAAQVVEDNIQMHSLRKSITRCIQSEEDASSAQ